MRRAGWGRIKKEISMFNWFKSNPNVDGLMRHKIVGITANQLEGHLESFYRQAEMCGEKIVRMKMVIRSSSDIRDNYAIIWTKGVHEK